MHVCVEMNAILFFSFRFYIVARIVLISYLDREIFFFFGKGKIGTKFNLRNVYRKNDKNDILLERKSHIRTQKRKNTK